MAPLRQLAFCLSVMLPLGAPAQADTIGPAQAKALQQQLKDWLGGLLGPSVTVPDLPLRLDGEGDHYRATLPLTGLGTGGDIAITATVRPLDGGRWAIDDVKLPAAASFAMTIPNSGDKAPPNGAPPKGATPGGPMKIDLHVGTQDSHAVIDPSLATPSTAEVNLQGITVVSDGPGQHQEQKIDVYRAKSSLTPTPGGTFDVDMDADMQGWRSAARLDSGTAVAFAAQRFHASGKIGGANRDRVNALIAAATGMLTALPAHVATKGSKTDLTPADRAQIRKVIEALNGAVQSVSMEEKLDGLQVEVSGMGGGTLQHLLLGFGGEAPDGKLHAWIDLGMDGLDSPGLPPKIKAFLPHHIALRPSLSGVQTADVAKLAMDATAEDPDDKKLEPDLAAIFAHGGVDLGIETLAFDLGPANVEGKGHLVALSPNTWRGQAHVTATGLDELTTQARTEPALQEALPVLVMLRGLAKPDGKDAKRMVWDIVSENGGVTVNGIDLSQLGGGGKPKPKAKPNAPNPPGQPRNR